MAIAPELDRNRLLAHLPDGEKRVLRGHLRLVSLHTKEELFDVGSPLRHIYFPIDSTISLLDSHRAGRTVEVAVVGKEGCTFSYLLDGLTVSPCRTIIQVGGSAFRLNMSELPPLLAGLPLFARMARRVGSVLFRHAVISVGCSKFHTVGQRLGRWLLAHHHRTGKMSFPFTHEFLAEQLGSQRATVTEGLADFQKRGLVTYGYGTVELLSVSKMEKVACECFGLAARAIEDYLTDIESYQA
jgi:CRP-like cAMP-binding protein